LFGQFKVAIRTLATAFSGIKEPHKYQAHIALGSNLGDRIAWIEKACNMMDSRGIRVIRTSGLWETKAMYVTDQPKFLNGACEIETSLRPIELLDQLQDIENTLGRHKIIDKGPRNIDLDILLYGSETVNTERLIVPHVGIIEREFVLRPLCQIIPKQTKLPGDSDSIWQRLVNLSLRNEDFQHDTTVVPTGESLEPLYPLSPTKDTLIMAILNVTPDSFSDGGRHDPSKLSDILKTAQDFVSAGASILDIGGQSSRPGAETISEAEEIRRVVPVIKHLRENGFNHAISIDTYRASVAEASITAGADIINDISAGALDENMFAVAARTGKTIILNHTRGSPEHMQQLKDYPNQDSAIISTICRELSDRVKAAEDAGIRRWRIILDPGIGFAKGEKENLTILRNIDQLRQRPEMMGIPWLIGASRKGFLGSITGRQNPQDRDWATAATTVAAVHGGADIVRVHNVTDTRDVVEVSKAIWRVDLDRQNYSL
jgi:2-amino-4-hydroxy-6-hydroxymethyldihydropteridine diphosphokinase/dihydropteroate synthase